MEYLRFGTNRAEFGLERRGISVTVSVRQETHVSLPDEEE